MLSKFFNKEFFDDRPLLIISGLALLSMGITILRVMTSVRAYDYKIAVGYTQYGADSFTLGEWYRLYELAIFAAVTTIAMVVISAKLHKVDKVLSYSMVILQHIVLIFLFLVANALLGASAIAT